MGQAKRKKETLLAENPLCIFCGGKASATTIDHQPARALFDRREWPEGYSFPACELCNRASKDAEHRLAVLVRMNSQREDDPQRRADTRKYLQAMRNNFPGMVRPMSIREKRRVFKSEGWRPPPNGFADLRMASMDADQADTAIRTVIGKIMRALHFKHTGGIVEAAQDLVVLHWFSNAYAFHLEDEEYTMFRSLPDRAPIVRAGRDLSDQFGYRYAVGETRDVSAFLIKFRMSLLAVGIVVQSPDRFLEEAQES